MTERLTLTKNVFFFKKKVCASVKENLANWIQLVLQEEK